MVREARLTRAYVGLGSNLDNPVVQVKTGLSALDLIPGTCCVGHSRLYWSKPLGGMPQPDYVNAVAALDTHLSPKQLLEQLQTIEQQHQRQRSAERWAPRTLDLDLLLYGDEQMHDEHLTVPHPGLPQRYFVLQPLFELAPDLHVPRWGELRALLDACPPGGLHPIETHA